MTHRSGWSWRAPGLAALLAGLLAACVLQPSSAAAMSFAPAEPANPWIAHVLVQEPNELDSCTGTVVGNRWILTAAHCIYSDDYKTRYGLDKIRVNLGRPDFFSSRNPGVQLKVDRAVVMPGYPALRANDALLLRLVGFDANRWHAVPIAHERKVVNAPVTVTLFGYGATRWISEKKSSGGGVLRKSPAGAFRRDPGCDDRFLCFRPTGKTKALKGDSGGPFVRWVAGAWQITGVAANVDGLSRSGTQGPVRAVGPFSATAPSKPLLQWVRSVAELPVPAANTIVRNRSNGASWLVGADGYRRWIPTGGDWLCLRGRGAALMELDQVSIDSIPDRVGVHARCAPPAPVAAAPPPPLPPPPPPPAAPTPPPPAPTTPKPYAGNLIAVNHGGGHVGVAFDVGWQAGRDPVTCRFYRNGALVFTAQCGTRASKQFYDLPAGRHTFHATVTDRFGVVSDPSNSASVTVAAPAPTPVSDRLSNDGRLVAASSQFLRSADGRYRFVMQSDSNLVLYGPSGRAIWTTSTVGRGVNHLRMQGDGNLVMYNGANVPIWSSNTPRHYSAYLVVQNDGNVVIYNGSQPIWSTGTAGRT